MRHQHYLLFISKNHKNIGASFPDMTSVLGEEGPACNVLLALSGFPKGREHFESRGMPQDVADGAFKDVSLWCGHFKKHKGFVGLAPGVEFT